MLIDFPWALPGMIVEAVITLGVALSVIEILLRVVKRYLKRYGKQVNALVDEHLVTAIRPFLYGIAILVAVTFFSTRVTIPIATVYLNAIMVLLGGYLAYKLVGRVFGCHKL